MTCYECKYVTGFGDARGHVQLCIKHGGNPDAILFERVWAKDLVGGDQIVAGGGEIITGHELITVGQRLVAELQTQPMFHVLRKLSS